MSVSVCVRARVGCRMQDCRRVAAARVASVVDCVGGFSFEMRNAGSRLCLSFDGTGAGRVQRWVERGVSVHTQHARAKRKEVQHEERERQDPAQGHSVHTFHLNLAPGASKSNKQQQLPASTRDLGKSSDDIQLLQGVDD